MLRAKSHGPEQYESGAFYINSDNQAVYLTDYRFTMTLTQCV